jgi:hypothetical protein
MPYAILNTDNTIHKIEYSNLPDGSENYSKYNVLPVNLTIPSGHYISNWFISGGTVHPITFPIFNQKRVPEKVGSGQIRLALIANQWVVISDPENADIEIDNWVFNLINSGITGVSDKMSAKLLWRNASQFERRSPFVTGAAFIAGKSSDDIDDLFIVANQF